MNITDKDGNGSGFDLPRPQPAPFRDPFQKTRLLSCPICFNGYPFNPTRRIPNPTRPDLIFIYLFFFPLNFMQWAEAQKQEGEVPATRHQSSLGPLG